MWQWSYEGKWWGDPKVRPILALHGLSDNSSTFDAILPLIEAPSVLAIDLPGHGLSSHISPGLSYDFPHVVTCIRYLVKNHFQWPKVDFLTHSFGSCTAFTYAGLFPKTVGKFISMDCARFNVSLKGSTSPALLQIAVERALESTNVQHPEEKSYEEHLNTFMAMRRDNGYPLSEKASKTLLTRILKETGPGKFVETPDSRLPVYIGILPTSSLNELAARITCEVLTFRFTAGVFQKWRKQAYEEQIAVMTNSSSNLVAVEIEGGHHAHLEDPESLAPHINDFVR